MPKLYVGNLSYRSTERDIQKAFNTFGEVTAVRLVLDRETGRSRGMAFVEMPNEEEALAAATALNGKEISGRVVTVSEARPEIDRRGHSNR